MDTTYIEEIKILSNTLYNCTVAMQIYKDIDSLKSAIKTAGFNKNSIKNEIKDKYIVFRHYVNEHTKGVYLAKFTGEIKSGGNGFIGPILLEMHPIKISATGILGLGNNGFNNIEDIRALFHSDYSWLYYNACLEKFYLDTKAFTDFEKATTYYNELVKSFC